MIDGLVNPTNFFVVGCSASCARYDTHNNRLGEDVFA